MTISDNNQPMGNITKYSVIWSSLQLALPLPKIGSRKVYGPAPILNFPPKMVSMNCALFVLNRVSNFMFYASPFPKIEAQSFGISPHFEFSTENGVDKLCLIRAESFFQFYVLCFTPSRNTNKNLRGSETITLRFKFFPDNGVDELCFIFC